MDKKTSRQYFNQQAVTWDETERSNAPHQLAALVERLHIPSDSLVLDVGSGTGVFVPYIQRKVGRKGRVVCVDYAFNMLLVARSKNNNHCSNQVCAEIETAGFQPGIFDSAVCYSTFPHFHDKLHALENMFRLLSPGGSVFICHSASRQFINAIHQNIPDFQDHLIPAKDVMFDLLKNAGFIKITIEEGADSYLACAQK